MKSYEKFTLDEKLTISQKTFFEKHGFLHFTNFFNQQTVDKLINASKEVEKKWIAENIKKINGVPVKYGKDFDGTPIIQRFPFINQQHPAFNELINDPRINALFELMGTDARLSISEMDGMVFNHYINHSQSSRSQMGWHTDALRDIFYGSKINPMLNIGFHLNSLKPEHGGLRILPGTHKQSVGGMLFRKVHIIDNSPDSDEIAIIANAGDLTIHDGRLWHRVQKSSIIGEQSRRRVIYIPIITGEYKPKNINSPTPLYQKIVQV